MIFGRVAAAEAIGAILAHTLRAGGKVLKKGRVLEHDDVERLIRSGFDELTVARLEDGDVDENRAAAAIGAAVIGPGIRAARAFTGRCNLYATTRGLLVADRDQIDALNRVNEAMTLACIPPYSVVDEGEMVATAKIIPFALPGELLEEGVGRCRGGSPVLRIAPFVAREAGLILTELPGIRPAVMKRASESQRARLERYGATIKREIRCPHALEAVRDAIAELLGEGCTLVLVLGASAIVDRADVIPGAVEAAGGVIEQLGMPVDPGNLLLLARHGEVPVIGVPGCARSLKPSGFDWVLARVAAALPIGPPDLMAMGAGGLLKEMPSRPHPREGHEESGQEESAHRVAAIVLAAGESKRMPDANKLLCDVDGSPMVVRVVDAVRQSGASPIVVVTGHDASALRDALRGRELSFVHNPDYREGMSTSLRAGLAAVEGKVGAALVCLADMPWVGTDAIDALLQAFDSQDPQICVPVHDRKRGNPVLWPARFFEAMTQITGDQGARRLLDEFAEEITYVPVSDESVNLDIDTPEALQSLRERSGSQS